MKPGVPPAYNAHERHVPGASLEQWKAEVVRVYPSAFFMTSPTGTITASTGPLRRVGKWCSPDTNWIRQ